MSNPSYTSSHPYSFKLLNAFFVELNCPHPAIATNVIGLFIRYFDNSWATFAFKQPSVKTTVFAKGSSPIKCTGDPGELPHSFPWLENHIYLESLIGLFNLIWNP